MSMYVPAGHKVHRAAPIDELEPAVVWGTYVPGRHGVQEEAPMVSEY
jgi:hypothetical protein